MSSTQWQKIRGTRESNRYDADLVLIVDCMLEAACLLLLVHFWIGSGENELNRLISWESRWSVTISTVVWRFQLVIWCYDGSILEFKRLSKNQTWDCAFVWVWCGVYLPCGCILSGIFDSFDGCLVPAFIFSKLPSSNWVSPLELDSRARILSHGIQHYRSFYQSSTPTWARLSSRSTLIKHGKHDLLF